MVGFGVPGSGFALQDGKGRDSSFTEALPSEKADLNLGLIQPTAVFGRVMDRQPVPEFGTFLFPEVVGKSFGAMDAQIIHDQIDRVDSGIVGDNGFQRRSYRGCKTDCVNGYREK